MSEPSAVAASVEEILPGVHHYRVHDDRIGTESEAYGVVSDDRVVLIDPLPIAPGLLDRVGRIEAIVLGAPSHQRSAWRIRRAAAALVHAPRGSTRLEEVPDVPYDNDDRLPGGLRAVHAPGPNAVHFALYLPSGPGVLFLADLAIHDPVTGPRFITDDHMADPALARRSARRLLDYRFDVLCFGHGKPIVQGGRAAFEAMLRRDGVSLE